MKVHLLLMLKDKCMASFIAENYLCVMELWFHFPAGVGGGRVKWWEIICRCSTIWRDGLFACPQ